MRLKEVSPNTLKGSFSNDLIIRKIWIVEELLKISNQFNTIYVLGSWYGNMGFIINKNKEITFNKIINVDLDDEVLSTSKKIYKKLNIKNSKFLELNVNKLKYKDAKNPNLVINTSTNNIDGTQWFENIPSGSLVVLQGRNNDDGAVNQFNNIKEFKESFPLKKILYDGTIDLSAAKADYKSFMIIGMK
jgi:hypothetical protein